MAGKRSRDKGKRGERGAAEALRPAWPAAQRSYHQSRDGSEAPDIEGADPLWPEVRVGKLPNPWKAYTDAKAAAPADRIPIAIVKRDREPYLAVLALDDFVAMIMRARDQ